MSSGERPIGGWVGRGVGLRPHTSLCTSNRPSFAGPFNKFHSSPKKNFLGSWVGGWVGQNPRKA